MDPSNYNFTYQFRLGDPIDVEFSNTDIMIRTIGGREVSVEELAAALGLDLPDEAEIRSAGFAKCFSLSIDIPRSLPNLASEIIARRQDEQRLLTEFFESTNNPLETWNTTTF